MLNSGDSDFALKMAKTIHQDQMRATALLNIVEAMVDTDHLESTLAIIELMDKKWHQNAGRKAIATIYAKNKRFEDAKKVADSIDDKSMRSEALRNVGLSLIQDSQFVEAESVYTQLTEKWDQVTFLKAMAVVKGEAYSFGGIKRLSTKIKTIIRKILAKEEQKIRENANKFLDDELPISRFDQEDAHISEDFQSLAKRFVLEGFFEEALIIISKIEFYLPRIESLCYLAVELAKSDSSRAQQILDEVDELQPEFSSPDGNARATYIMALACLHANFLDRAEALIHSISDSELQVRGFRSLALKLASSDIHRANMIFEKSRDVFPIENVNQAASLGNLAIAFAKLGDEKAIEIFQKAWEIEEAVPQIDYQRRMYAVQHFGTIRENIFTELARVALKNSSDALPFINSLKNPVTKIELYCEIATSKNNNHEVHAQLQKIQRIANQIGDEISRSIALAIVGLVYAKIEHSKYVTIIQKAISTLSQCDDKYKCAEALCYIVEKLSDINDDQVDGVYQKIMDLLDDIKYPTNKINILCNLGKALSGTQNERAIDVLENAWRLTMQIEDGPFYKASSLIGLAEVFSEVSENRANAIFEEAQIVALEIEEGQRTDVLCEIGKAMARTGRIEQANIVVKKIWFDEERKAVLISLADRFARDFRFDEALAILDECDLDEFMTGLARIAPACEQVLQGMGSQFLIRCLFILGWFRSDLADIYRLLS